MEPYDPFGVDFVFLFVFSFFAQHSSLKVRQVLCVGEFVPVAEECPMAQGIALC